MFYREIEKRLQQAVLGILPDADASTVLLRPCPDPKFGDYQTTALMALAKARKLNPRQLAQQVLSALDVSAWCSAVDIAGAGFLNFRIKPETLTQALQAIARSEGDFYVAATQPRTIVIDFSSPNVAKPMHVGHIRSTGIGDALQRIFRLLGHRVITDNHIGDWGTQFGMLLFAWKNHLDKAALAADAMAELERLYRLVSGQCDEAKPGFDASVRDTSRAELVKLQAGDQENLGIWREMIRLSQVQFDSIYSRLGVKFDHTLGESFYNPWLPGIVEELLARGIARASEGAVGVFSDGTLPPKEDPFLTNRDGEWVADPALVRKGDGGFNYTTTDLATVDYRMKTWAPDEIIYVVDDRQALHFKKLFLAFARWQPEAVKRVRLRHIGFGKILGDDGKPYKTRSGDTVKLADLLDEAEERALKVVTEKNPDLTGDEQKEIARVIGLGSVKYQDLLPNRQSDYVFSWDKMLALQGNTGPYLLYAHTRIGSIIRKSGAEVAKLDVGSLNPTAPEEIALVKHLFNFGPVLEAVAEECRPNYLCNYLYELSSHVMVFVEACNVIKAEEPVRTSRLLLCELSARVLRQGLGALGIEVTAKM